MFLPFIGNADNVDIDKIITLYLDQLVLIEMYTNFKVLISLSMEMILISYLYFLIRSVCTEFQILLFIFEEFPYAEKIRIEKKKIY